jgi:hypothetical protein
LDDKDLAHLALSKVVLVLIDHTWSMSNSELSLTLQSVLTMYHRKFNLKTAVEDVKVMEDLELESLTTGAEHSPRGRRPWLLAIMAQEITSICRLQLPFLGLKHYIKALYPLIGSKVQSFTVMFAILFFVAIC